MSSHFDRFLTGQIRPNSPLLNSLRLFETKKIDRSTVIRERIFFLRRNPLCKVEPSGFSTTNIPGKTSVGAKHKTVAIRAYPRLSTVLLFALGYLLFRISRPINPLFHHSSEALYQYPSDAQAIFVQPNNTFLNEKTSVLAPVSLRLRFDAAVRRRFRRL